MVKLPNAFSKKHKNMNVTDSIIRIKNGYMSGKRNVELNFSKINSSILEVLKREKYIKDYKIIMEDNKKLISVELAYEGIIPVIKEIEIVSKPGRRIYSKSSDLKPVLGGLGISVLTTPKGVMSDREARKQGKGGEILFKVW